jgi:hypothetical protein
MPMENKNHFTPQFGAPPQGSNAISRFMGYVRAFALPAVVIGGVLIFGAEKMFLPEYRPSHQIGIFLGNIEKAEIGAKQQASTEYANRMAEAQAKAQANAQIEAEVARQQQEAVRESLSGQSTMAVLSDHRQPDSPQRNRRLAHLRRRHAERLRGERQNPRHHGAGAGARRPQRDRDRAARGRARPGPS